MLEKRGSRTHLKVKRTLKGIIFCKRVRDATLLSIFQFFTFAARI